MRRQGHPLYGARYCANTSPSKKEVHDLDNEKAVCQIDEIIKAGHARPYHTLESARAAGSLVYWKLKQISYLKETENE